MKIEVKGRFIRTIHATYRTLLCDVVCMLCLYSWLRIDRDAGPDLNIYGHRSSKQWTDREFVEECYVVPYRMHKIVWFRMFHLFGLYAVMYILM